MLLINEENKTLILDSIHTPIKSQFMWVLDLSLQDFTLAPINMLEETHSPALLVDIVGFHVIFPANWFVVVYDTETTQIDVVKFSELTGFKHTIMGGTLNSSVVIPIQTTIIDYNPRFVHVSPSLNKHQMLCHPIAPDIWINISPTDPYNKFLKNTSVGDFL